MFDPFSVCFGFVFVCRLSVVVSYNLFEKFLKTSAARTRMDANITLSQGVSSLKKFEKINKLNIIATHDNNAHDL
jgi:hypothetical protein